MANPQGQGETTEDPDHRAEATSTTGSEDHMTHTQWGPGVAWHPGMGAMSPLAFHFL